MSRAKMAEPITLPFEMVSGVVPSNRVSDQCAHWRRCIPRLIRLNNRARRPL